MGLFKAKNKTVIDYETEATLPSFSIDTNGFIMFDDSSLGGAAVLEVIPHFFTESVTHEDPLYHDDSTDTIVNPDYEPPVGALFPDKRKQVYPSWIYFLNSLQMQDDSDEPTHVQIMIKKVRSDEWYTRTDYAVYKESLRANELVDKAKNNDPHDVLLAARAVDYVTLLEENQRNIRNAPNSSVDVRKLAGYKTRFFLVVGYTPSSEGWWMDGRDTDYYITDNNIVDTLFKDNADKMVDRVVNLIANRRERKDDTYSSGGQEDDFFWIQSDRTAQIITTRIQKIKNAIKQWNNNNPDCQMSFHLKDLEGVETAALVAFFPNIMTPYWDKIWTLKSNQDDVLYQMDVRNALALGDTSIVNQGQLVQDIALGQVDMRHTYEEQEKFLNQYKNKAYDEIEDIFAEHDALNWSAEREEKMEQWKQESLRQQELTDDVWGDFNTLIAVDEEYKTPAQKREEFLRKYKNKPSIQPGEMQNSADANSTQIRHNNANNSQQSQQIQQQQPQNSSKLNTAAKQVAETPASKRQQYAQAHNVKTTSTPKVPNSLNNSEQVNKQDIDSK